MTVRASDLVKREATFKTTREGFIAAATLAAPCIEQRGGTWCLDGHKSDKIYLRLICDPAVPGLPPHLDTDFDVDYTSQAVTLSVQSRSDSTLKLYAQFVQALSQLLPRSAH